MKEATKTPQGFLSCQGIWTGKQQQQFSFTARSGWNSVSRHLGPIINPTVSHVSALRVPPHALAQEILASAKMCWSLRSGQPEGNTVTHTVDTVYNLEGCTGADAPWDVGGLWLRPRLLEQTLKFVFSHKVCESQCVRIKRKGRRRKGKCTSHPAFFLHRWTLSGAVDRFYLILITLISCCAYEAPQGGLARSSLYSGTSFRVF